MGNPLKVSDALTRQLERGSTVGRSLPSGCHAVLDPSIHAGLRAEHRVPESGVTERANVRFAGFGRPSSGLERAP